MTPEEINDIANASIGKLTDSQCRTLTHYAIGLLRYSTNVDSTRNSFFTQVKLANEGKNIPSLI